jgi:hypothetical protein
VLARGLVEESDVCFAGQQMGVDLQSELSRESKEWKRLDC